MTWLLEISTSELLHFTAELSTRDWRKLTDGDYAEIGVYIATDGCSGVPDFYLNCCIIHDWWYRTHRNLDGTPIARAQADKRLEQCIQSTSWLGRWSPMAYWRYQAVRKFGKKAWG